eukprot:s5968_g1.t2
MPVGRVDRVTRLASLHAPEPLDDVTQLASLPGYVRLPCNPCIFFASNLRCKRGDRCLFCHHPADKGSQHRPRKATRDEVKAFITQSVRQLNLQTQEPQEIVVLLQREAWQYNFARRFCIEELDRAGAQGSGTEQRDDRANAVNSTVQAQGTGDATGTCEGIVCFCL